MFHLNALFDMLQVIRLVVGDTAYIDGVTVHKTEFLDADVVGDPGDGLTFHRVRVIYVVCDIIMIILSFGLIFVLL